MKIVFLVSSLGSGGAERVATTLCNTWADRGDVVTLVPTFPGRGQAFYPVHNKVNLIFLSELTGVSTGNGKKYFARLVALRRLVRDEHPDAVISFLPNVNIGALLATAFSGVPCIVCERSDPSAQPLSMLLGLACRALYRFADVVTVQTGAVASRIGKLYGGLRRVAVVPNPLPCELTYIRADLCKQKERHILLSLGRLSEEKQLLEIVEVFAELADHFPKWDLHVYGEGPQREAVSDCIARFGLQQRVLMMGSTNTPLQVMSEADVFVMNSRFEGFPNALLEAMGVGLPCVSADCPSGPREISADGHDALLFAPGDLQGMCSALESLMADPVVRETMGRRARSSVMERYALRTVLQSWDDLFASVKKSIK